MTIQYCMNLKYDYGNNEDNDTSFNQISLQTAEMLMFKSVKE